MLGITSIRKIPGLYMRLRKAGFDVSEHLIEAQTNSKRPRRFPLLLARKPAGQHEES